MFPTLPLALTAATVAMLYARRRAARSRTSRSGRPIPTRAELADLYRELSAVGRDEHRARHRYIVTITPEARGTICHLCREVIA